MIKPEEFNSKLLEIQDEYEDTYEMFDYLNKSRDEYISENLDLRDENCNLRKDIGRFKKLFIYIFICFIIEFILFLVVINS